MDHNCDLVPHAPTPAPVPVITQQLWDPAKVMHSYTLEQRKAIAKINPLLMRHGNTGQKCEHETVSVGDVLLVRIM